MLLVFAHVCEFSLLENVPSWSTFMLQKEQLGLLVSGPLLWGLKASRSV